MRFSDVGWTDITSTTAATTVVLEGLGYEPETELLSVPVTYASLKNEDIDVFLGNWMPTMEGDVRPYLDDGSVENVGVNLEGAKYTLAVPSTSPTRASRTSPTSRRFDEQLDGKIYGIEPGNDGNRLILQMIEENAFGLGGFELVESSEQGMLAQVARATRSEEPIVFLGWEPHPMNANFELAYLVGRRRVVRPELRRRHGLHQRARGPAGGMPEPRPAAQEPEVHARRWRTRSWARSSTTARRPRTPRAPGSRSTPTCSRAGSTASPPFEGEPGLAGRQAAPRHLLRSPRVRPAGEDWLTR